MKALIINKYGTISDIKISEIDKPITKDNEVLVKIYAAAINPADLKVITGKDGGKFLHAHNFPFILGFDYSGVIEEIGQNVSSFQPQDEVFGFLEYSMKNRQGTFAEYVSVLPETLAKKPKTVSFVEAAAVATTGSTALQCFKDKCNLQSGQKVLVNGASGGVGSYAVQIAKNIGAEVWGICSSRNFDYVKRLGAEQVFDYNNMNLKQLSEKFDVFFDISSSSSFSDTMDILVENGTYVTLLPSLSFAIGKLRSLLRTQACKFVMVKSKTADLSLLSNWMKEDRLNVSIDTSFSLTDATRALQKFKTGGVTGKIAIVIDG
jgi:NADPH:quinone reductase-like Zn-dependent oxidoreductase